MEIKFVQFSDSDETSLVSVFSCRQDEGAYPNQGEVEATDERYISFMQLFPGV
jgi:hypothetical protein